MKMQIRVAAEGNVLITKTYEYEKYEVSTAEVTAKIAETASIVTASIESMRVRFDKPTALLTTLPAVADAVDKSKK